MRALGIILAGGNNNRMRELSNRRAIAAMPVAGSYRSIDFALSNMTNSHIAKVAVLTQYHARSLNEHLSYKNLKRIYGYKIQDYWNNISTVEAYYKTNMDFLKPEVRDYFFRQYPGINSKIDDLPPAKYNPGCLVKNSLVSSGCIINGQVENSVLFKKVYVGNNCVIKNSIILNDVYLGDNTHIENCIVESRDTIRANSYYCGEGEIKVVVEKNERYAL